MVVAPNLGWRDYPLSARLSAPTGLPVVLDNDANCATLGEWWIGAARGARHVVGLTIGTGIGAGLILDGRLHSGFNRTAGEIGHMILEVGGPKCGCGVRGHLEAWASGPSIATAAVHAARRHPSRATAGRDPG